MVAVETTVKTGAGVEESGKGNGRWGISAAEGDVDGGQGRGDGDGNGAKRIGCWRQIEAHHAGN